jgi:flagellar biosynthesis/type III secretory pathway chaperone
MTLPRRRNCSTCCTSETVALHGRDMPLLEQILARKQSLIILLEQHGQRRSQLLASLGLSADRAGVQALPRSRPMAMPCCSGSTCCRN